MIIILDIQCVCSIIHVYDADVSFVTENIHIHDCIESVTTELLRLEMCMCQKFRPGPPHAF